MTEKELSKVENMGSACGEDTLDLNDFVPATSPSVSRGSNEPGPMSLVNSAKNGKRLTLHRSVMEALGNPKTLQVALGSDKIAVGERLHGDEQSYNLKRGKNRGIIYAAGLVREITERYGLDFSGRTSITFREVEYHRAGGHPVAVIKVR